MAAGPLSVAPNTSTNNDGILIGDRVYSEVYLTISNSLIPEERLQPTPSMLDGLDLHTETDLPTSYIYQSLGDVEWYVEMKQSA